MNGTTTAASIEATAASKAILSRLHPGRQEMGAAEAMNDVASVLGLERMLRAAIAECPDGDWRAVAATLIRVMREAKEGPSE